MTMSWSNEVAESTQNATRSLLYVPPHLRGVNNGVNSFDNASWYGSSLTESTKTQYGFRSNRPGSAGSGRAARGRGGPGGQSQWRIRQGKSWGSSQSLGQEVSAVSEKLDDLEVSEDEEVEGGGGGSGGGGGGINFDAYEDIPVEASGRDIPPAASTFAEIRLGERLSDNIRRCKYVKPTPIQRHAIPIAVAGRDLMACAQTGSGKTAAFCFPIISGIFRSRPFQSLSRYGQTVSFPSALILSPTRELASQVYLVFLLVLSFCAIYDSCNLFY